MSGINFNPLPTTNAAGSFAVQSSGYIQGVAMDDPALRNELAGGVLGPNETLPLWGGVLISETTAPVAGSGTIPSGTLGGYVTRATGLTQTASGGASGFSVFNQAHNWLNFPQSQVPTAQPGMGVNFYRFGSGMRVPVNCAAILADLEGGPIGQQVSWDFTAQELIPYTAGYAQVTITGATWAATAGGQVSFTVGTDLTAVLAAGDVIEVTGVVNTAGAGGATGVYNGQFTVVSVPDSTHVVVSYPAAVSPGTYASGGHILAEGGALPVKVLDVQVGNSMVVSYSPVTGFANWNRQGTCALLLL